MEECSKLRTTRQKFRILETSGSGGETAYAREKKDSCDIYGNHSSSSADDDDCRQKQHTLPTSTMARRTTKTREAKYVYDHVATLLRDRQINGQSLPDVLFIDDANNSNNKEEDNFKALCSVITDLLCL